MRPERPLFSRNFLPTPFSSDIKLQIVYLGEWCVCVCGTCSGAATSGGGNGSRAVVLLRDPDRVESHPALTWGGPVLQGPGPRQVGSLGGRGLDLATGTGRNSLANFLSGARPCWLPLLLPGKCGCSHS